MLRKKYRTQLQQAAKTSGVGTEHFKKIIEHYREQEKKIVKIQALWRGRRTRRDILSFFQQPNPSFKVVRLFLPVLAFSTEDYDRELQLQVFYIYNINSLETNHVLVQLNTMLLI